MTDWWLVHVDATLILGTIEWQRHHWLGPFQSTTNPLKMTLLRQWFLGPHIILVKDRCDCTFRMSLRQSMPWSEAPHQDRPAPVPKPRDSRFWMFTCRDLPQNSRNSLHILTQKKLRYIMDHSIPSPWNGWLFGGQPSQGMLSMHHDAGVPDLFLDKNWSTQSKVPSSGKPTGKRTWLSDQYGSTLWAIGAKPNSWDPCQCSPNLTASCLSRIMAIAQPYCGYCGLNR